MLNKTILSLLLSTASAASLAADYYVVVPSKGRADSDPHSAIRVSLNSYNLPGGEVGVAYSFSLHPLLSVTGDAAYSGGGVTWGVISSSRCSRDCVTCVGNALFCRVVLADCAA